MKVFVARALAVPEPDDFHWAIDGELVTVPLIPCDCPGCGCRQSMAGVVSARATTMFTVADLAMTTTEYVAALRDGLQLQGWWTGEHDDRWLIGLAVEQLRLAATIPIGAALRVDEQHISRRALAA